MNGLQVGIQLGLMRGHRRAVQAGRAVERGRHAQRLERHHVGAGARHRLQRRVAGCQLPARRDRERRQVAERVRMLRHKVGDALRADRAEARHRAIPAPAPCLGGLGAGSALTAIGGAAGAGMSSLLANQVEKISKSVGDTTGPSLVGNIAANVAATVGGALVGGSAGAAMASNVQLYNAGNDSGDKDAQAKAAGIQGLINQALATTSGTLGSLAGLRNPVSDAIGTAVDSAASQFGTLMKRDAQDKISQSPAQLISQGVANGVGAVVGMGGR
ncbi:putative hemagglutination activity domain protein [Burkholderia pseudomallei]|uniref:Hemagglutination activity domain protein n=1 Tax=Burkholderia pseudomallei TaxID=28450 RepID=A0AA40MH81_BURPE|nr:putative hemagglutination activity domain protein [Burkholderia pseudomallei]